MRIILTPAGSAGDVHPFLGIGRELARRGYRVVVVTAEPFRPAVEALGFEFVGTWSQADFDRVVRDPDLWHPRRGMGVILGAAGQVLADMHRILEEVWEPGAVLVGHSISLATRVFEDLNRVPAVTVHLSPNVMRSDHRQPILVPGLDISCWPRWAKRAGWWLVDRLLLDPHIAPALNRRRRELGLTPVRRVFRRWIHSPRGLVGMFPDWFAAPQPDWPKHLHLTGFALFDPGAEQSLDPTLARALQRRPIVFSPGSANAQAEAFFRAAAGAVGEVGRPALFMTPYRAQCPAELPDGVLHVPFAPFGRVLPHCAAVVHHGGIGSCAQGLAAGIPQLIMPMGFDQPDNAARLKRLGAGAWIRPSRFTAARVAESLGRLLEDDAVVDRCRELRGRIEATDAIARTCDVIEKAGQT